MFFNNETLIFYSPKKFVLVYVYTLVGRRKRKLKKSVVLQIVNIPPILSYLQKGPYYDGFCNSVPYPN